MSNIDGDISDSKGHGTGTDVNPSNFLGSLQVPVPVIHFYRPTGQVKFARI